MRGRPASQRSAPRVTETYTASAAGAVAGLIQWAVATYAFGGNPPSAITGAIYILVPGVLGGGIAFFTRRTDKLPEPPPNPPSPEPLTAPAD